MLGCWAAGVEQGRARGAAGNGSKQQEQGRAKPRKLEPGSARPGLCSWRVGAAGSGGLVAGAHDTRLEHGKGAPVRATPTVRGRAAWGTR